MSDFGENVKRITAERGSVYGPPRENFRRIAALQAVVAECKHPLARVALNEIAVKMSRLIESPEHVDSWDDIGGYAKCGKEVTRPLPAVEPIIP